MRITNFSALAAAIALLAGAALAGGAAAQTVGTGSSSTIGSGVQSGNNASPDATQLRATEGNAAIDSSNVDALARSGNLGTSATTSLSMGDGLSGPNDTTPYSTQQGQAPRLPSPRVGIDLGSIRSGLEAAPSATPDAAGD